MTTMLIGQPYWLPPKLHVVSVSVSLPLPLLVYLAQFISILWFSIWFCSLPLFSWHSLNLICCYSAWVNICLDIVVGLNIWASQIVCFGKSKKYLNMAFPLPFIITSSWLLGTESRSQTIAFNASGCMRPRKFLIASTEQPNLWVVRCRPLLK